MLAGQKVRDFNQRSGGDYDIMVAILERCDEPTRDAALSVCRAMSEASRQARRKWVGAIAAQPDRWTSEALPTMLELSDNGCHRPDSANILRTLVPGKKPPASDGSLHWFHHRRSLVDECERYGVGANIRFFDRIVSGGFAAEITHAVARVNITQFGRQDVPASGDRPAFMYEGGFGADGQPRGLCHIRFGAEGVYEGGYDRPHYQGPGLLVEDGVRYEGHFSSNTVSGLGTIKGPRGEVFRGEIDRNRRHGKGEQIDENGGRISGVWCQDVFTGDPAEQNKETISRDR